MRVIAASPSAEVTMYSEDVNYLATGLSTQLQDCDTLTAEVRPCSFFYCTDYIICIIYMHCNFICGSSDVIIKTSISQRLSVMCKTC